MIHARCPRTFAKARVQARQLLARSLGQHFDGSIGIVPDPSCDLKDVRFALDKPAEANTLDTAADDKAAGLHGRLIFWESHREIAEVRLQR